MELYVFLITALVRVAAALAIVFNYFYEEAPYPFFPSIGHVGQRALMLIKKVKYYRRSKSEKVLVFIGKIRSLAQFSRAANNRLAINKSVENERAIISNQLIENTIS